MRRTLSDECWAAIAIELLKSLYLGEAKSYREIAELVRERGYCRERPSLSTISYIKEALKELPRAFRRVRIESRTKEAEGEEHTTPLLEQQRKYLIEFIIQFYIVKYLQSIIKGEFRDELINLLLKLVENKVLMKDLENLMLEPLKNLFNLFRRRGDFRIYPEGYMGYQSIRICEVDGASIKLLVTSRVDFVYYDGNMNELVEFNDFVTNVARSCEVPTDVRDEALVIKMILDAVRRGCLEYIIGIYSTLLINLNEYYRKFMFSKVFLEKLYRLIINIANEECCSGDLSEVCKCLRRRRGRIKEVAKTLALSDGSVDVRHNEVKGMKVIMRVTPKEDENMVKVSIRVKIPVILRGIVI